MALAHERYAKWLLPTDDRRVRRHRDEVLAFGTSPFWPEPRPEPQEILVAEVEPAAPAVSDRWHGSVRANPDNVRRLLAETRGPAKRRSVETVAALNEPRPPVTQPKSRRDLLRIFEELSRMSDRLDDGWSSSG